MNNYKGLKLFVLFFPSFFDFVQRAKARCGLINSVASYVYAMPVIVALIKNNITGYDIPLGLPPVQSVAVGLVAAYLVAVCRPLLNGCVISIPAYPGELAARQKNDTGGIACFNFFS